MSGHGEKFGRKKEEAIAALLTQPSVEAAARAIGIAPRTLFSWLRISEFQTAYRKARRDVQSQATARLQHASGAAAGTMLKLMVDINVPAAVRLRAAEAVYDRGIKGIEIEDIEVRVDALEQAAELSKDGRN
jgi:transposase-like protein